MAVTHNYDYNNFISQATSDSKYIKIYDKYGNYKYTIDVMISYYFYKDRYVYIKIENSNDITLDFESSSIAMSALQKLNEVKKDIAQNVSNDIDYYTKTELNLGQLDNRYYTNTAVTNILNDYSLTSHTHDLVDMNDVQLSSITNGQVLVYQNGDWVNSSFTFNTSAFTSNYYTIDELSSSTSDVYINWNHIIGAPTGASGYGITDVYTTAQTYTKDELNPNPGSPGGSGVLDDRYYTKLQVFTKTESNENYLSANTAIYNRTDAENSFLSANTSYYTQQYINDNFSNTSHTHNNYSLSSHTHLDYSITSHTHVDYSLSSHTHNNYSITSHTHNLSDIVNSSHTHTWDNIVNTAHTHSWNNITNTSHTHDEIYYTKTELNSGELDNLYYTKNQVYTKVQVDGLLTGITNNTTSNYYTTAQTNANFLSANTSLFSSSSHTHTLSSLSGVTIATPQNNNFLVYYGGVWVNSAVSFDTSNFYTKTQLDNGQLDYLYISISGNSNISGDLIPSGDGLYKLGSSSNQWKELHVSGGTIYIDGYPVTVVNGQLIVNGQTIATTAQTANMYSLTSHTHTQYSLTGHNHDILYYTKSQVYLKTEINSGFLSANTSFYTQPQSNANFLSANTSFYTTAQTLVILSGYSLSSHTHNLSSLSNTAHTHDQYSPTSHTHALSSLTSTAHTHLWNDITNTSHTHNIYALTSHTHGDYSITSHTHNDYSITGHNHDTDYYTKIQVYNKIEVGGLLTAITNSTSNGYYNSAQTNALLLGYSTTSHTHTLPSLSGVSITTPTQNEILIYSAGTWVNATLPEIGVDISLYYTSAQTNTILNNYSSTGHSHDFTGLTSTAHTHDERYYTKGLVYNSAQTNANFLSANTSIYTQSQSNANFLSANTSFYTTAQTISILNNYSVSSHTHLNYSFTSHTHNDYSLTSHTHNYSLTSHTHDFTGLTNTAHTHLWSDIANTSHTHTDYSLTSHTHNYSLTSHTHDDRYYLSSLTYSITQVDNKLLGYYNSSQTNTMFYNSAQTNAIFSQTGHSHSLTALTDVVLSAITQGQILVYSAGTWVNSAVTINLSSYYTASEVDSLIYNLTGGTGSQNLWEMLDVNSGISTGSVAGESLVYDGSKWTNSAVTLNLSAYYTSAQTNIIFYNSAQTNLMYSKTGHSHSLSALTDVMVTAATNGQFLQYSGGTWYPVTSPILVGNFVNKTGDTMSGELSFDFMSGTTNRILNVNTGGTVKEGEEIVSLYITDPTIITYLTSGDTYWSGRTFTYTGLTAVTYEGQKYIDENYFYEYFDATFYRTYYSEKEHDHDTRYYTQTQLLPISGAGVLDIRYITYSDLSGLTLQSLNDVSLTVPNLTNQSFLKWDSTSGWTNYVIDLTGITWKPEGVLTGTTVTGISGLTGGGTLNNNVQIRHATKTVSQNTTPASLSSIVVGMTFDAYGHTSTYTVADFTGTIKEKLSEMNDVIITGPQADHYLYYNTVSSKWINGALTISKVSGLTTQLANCVKLSPSSTPQTINGNLILVNDVYYQNNKLYLGAIPLSTDGTNLLWSGVTISTSGINPGGTTGSIQIKSGSTFSYTTKFNFDFVNESITFGVRSGTTGAGSMVFGYNNIASGQYSFAVGLESKAIADYSSVVGYGSTASGYVSSASGKYCTASGSFSHSQGYYTTASVNAAHSEGGFTTASGYYSHAEGNYTTSIGNSSHSGGKGYSATYQIISQGISSFNHSFRLDATPDTSGATGNYSAILGGINNSAIGDGSSVIGGDGCVASGNYALAEGHRNIASGYGSHAEGTSNISSGNFSHAEGASTIASANYSHSQGFYTTASAYGSHTGGKGYNDTYQIIASGIASFNHSSRDNNTSNVSGATGNYSVIIGGLNHSVTSNSGAILGGTGNTVRHDRSIILGGYGITTNASDTVYGINFRASNLISAATYYGSGSNLTGIAAGTTGYLQINSAGTFATSFLYFDFTLSAITFGSRTGDTGVGSIVMGNGSASGVGSFAKNVSNKALGNYSNATGKYTIAGGESSYSGGEGYNGYELISSGLTSFNHSYRGNTTPNVSGATGNYSAILGGINNSAILTSSVVIGSDNCVSNCTYSSIMSAHDSNILSATGEYNAIIGGDSNTISGGKPIDSVIIGGLSNTIGSLNYSAIVGGTWNTIAHDNTVILAGSGITTLSENSVYVPTLYVNDAINIGNGNSLNSLAAISVFGTNTFNSTLAFYNMSDDNNSVATVTVVKGAGSYSTLLPTPSGKTLGAFGFTGFESSGISGIISGDLPASISVETVENFSLSGHGVEMLFKTTTIGETDAETAITIKHNKYVEMNSGATIIGSTKTATIELTQQSDTTIIMKDYYTGTRYKLFISGGTLAIQTA